MDGWMKLWVDGWTDDCVFAYIMCMCVQYAWMEIEMVGWWLVLPPAHEE